MQSIETRYRPATTSRPAKIYVKASGGKSATYSFAECTDENDTIDGDIAHRNAMRRFCESHEWYGVLIEGSTKHGKVFVFNCGHITAVQKPMPEKRIVTDRTATNHFRTREDAAHYYCVQCDCDTLDEAYVIVDAKLFVFEIAIGKPTVKLEDGQSIDTDCDGRYVIVTTKPASVVHAECKAIADKLGEL